MSAQNIRLLILGTGGMARSHAKAFDDIEDVTIVAGVDTNAENLTKFQDKFGIEHGFATLEDAIAWGEFDAACNVTPDAIHYKTTMALLAAGKHVFCEKPLATNYTDAAEMTEAAEKAGVVNMVNLTYRNVASLNKAREMIEQGAIGEIRHFDASYLQSWLTQPSWGEWSTETQWLWRLSTSHGSNGTLGDIGIHILDFATYIAGSNAANVSARLKTFDKAPDNKIGEYTLDANDSIAMHIGLENGAIGVLHATRFASGHLNDLQLKIYGTKGGLDVRYEGNVSALRASIGDDMPKAKWVDIDCPDVPTNYQKFAAAIREGKMGNPDFARGAALQKVLDLAATSDAQNGVTLTA
ncbi:MAG: Gfo/Idh/MocA family protein [Paracoccaceae bacterium]